jgi:hypothetical protein
LLDINPTYSVYVDDFEKQVQRVEDLQLVMDADLVEVFHVTIPFHRRMILNRIKGGV